MNTLQSIFEAANRKVDFDNRNFRVKSINAALENGQVKVEVSPAQKIFNEKNEKQSNYRIYIGKTYWWGYVKRTAWLQKVHFGQGADDIREEMRYNNESLIDSMFNSLCKAISTPEIKEAMKKAKEETADACVCGKCHGKGIIPEFRHISQGVCFDCLGIGYKFKNSKW